MSQILHHSQPTTVTVLPPSQFTGNNRNARQFFYAAHHMLQQNVHARTTSLCVKWNQGYVLQKFSGKKFLNDCSFYGNQPTTPSWYHTVSCSCQTQQCSQVLMVNCSGSNAQIVGLVFSLYQPYGFHTKLITDILCIDICCCPFPGKKRRRRVVCCIFNEIYHSKSDLKCIRHQATDVEGLATFVKQSIFWEGRGLP